MNRTVSIGLGSACPGLAYWPSLTSVQATFVSLFGKEKQWGERSWLQAGSFRAGTARYLGLELICRPHLSISVPQIGHVFPPHNACLRDAGLLIAEKAALPQTEHRAGSKLIPQRFLASVPYTTRTNRKLIMQRKIKNATILPSS